MQGQTIITPDDEFKGDIVFIRKNAHIKFHHRRVERNKIKLNRIKQLQSRKSSDVKQSRDKAHSAVSDPNAIKHADRIENIQKRMYELNQMMLDLEKKNKNKEGESYPDVSLMSTSHFEREKTPTKSAIGTIKRYERRKKLRCDIYQVKQETNKRFIKNLSNFQLTQAQISLLSRGLKLIPTPATNESHIRAQLLNDFKAFARRMRLQYIFYDQEKEPHSFHMKSNWKPPVQPSVTL